ncbi:MAG: protoporphyrinogen oxidase [Caldithrix sp.]|nr:protoporphyrinogen oxidase [Caldithrix sp.]
MAAATKIAVIGSGISGLTMAYWLTKKGYDVSVIEQSDHVGGSIVTENQDGFLIDLGPNSTLETSETLKQLVRDLGIEDQKVYGSEKSNNRYVVRNGRLHALPMSPMAFIKTRLFSTRAKFRLILEPFIKRTDGRDLPLSEFVKYRLGEEFLDYAINPFVAGVYAGDPAKLSTATGFPKLYALEQNYGSFIKGAIKGARERKKRDEVAKDRAKLFSFMEGMETLTSALAKELEGRIYRNCEVIDLVNENDTFKIKLNNAGQSESRVYEKVVISAPTFNMAEFMSMLTSEEIRTLQDVYYPPVDVIFMGFHKDDVNRKLDGFGFLVPKVENRQILGSIWSSSIFPNRAPEDHVAFTTFVGGTRQPENTSLNDTELAELVYNDLNGLVGLSGEPVITRIKRWPKAIPQYRMGYQKVQQMFDDLENKIPGLYFSGNFRRGISVGDSVLSAEATLTKMLADLE